MSAILVGALENCPSALANLPAKTTKPRPAAPGGVWVPRSIAVRGAGARPDQVEGLAVFVGEQAGEDRGGEAGIVELDREIVAAFLGGLLPAGADLGLGNEHSVRRGVFVLARFLGDDGDVLLLQAHRDDLAGVVGVAGLLEGADICHDTSPCVGRTPRSFAASMAGFRQGIAPLHPQGRNAVKDGADRGFLPREEWAERPGEESPGCPVAARGKRRSRPLPTKAIDEAVGERGFRPLRARRFGKGRVARSMSG